MNEWTEQSLEEVAEIIGGGTPSTAEPAYWGGNIPWLTPRDLSGVTRRFISNGERNISELGLKNSSARMLPKGTVLLTSRAPIGYLAIAERELTTNQGFQSLVPHPKTDNQFLYYLLKNSVEYLKSQGEGTTFGEISKSTVKGLRFVFPPFERQQAIAEVLSSLDDKIDLLHRQNKTLESLAQTIFRQWFIEEANPAWKTTRLSDHTFVLRGLSYRGAGLTDGTDGLPMHNLNSVYEFGGYKPEGIKYYNGDHRDRHLLRAGDIIVTNTEQGHEHRLIGFPAVVPDTFGQTGLFSQHIYRIVLNDKSSLTSHYLYYLLMSPQVREQILGATNGSTVNMLAIDGLQMPEFALAPIDRIKEFSKIAEDLWQKQGVNRKQITSLTKLRDSLLPKLMSGEVALI
ncbi:MAG: restriction endonuclease subunit S [Pyrinomonadaceae bacterium]